MLIGLAVGVVLNYVSPPNIFVYVYSASVLPGMVPWFVILISHIGFRRAKGAALDQHPFKMPLAPLSNYLTIGFLLMVLVFMFFNQDTRISLIVGIVFLIVVTLSFYAFGIGKRKPIQAGSADQTVK